MVNKVVDSMYYWKPFLLMSVQIQNSPALVSGLQLFHKAKQRQKKSSAQVCCNGFFYHQRMCVIQLFYKALQNVAEVVFLSLLSFLPLAVTVKNTSVLVFLLYHSIWHCPSVRKGSNIKKVLESVKNKILLNRVLSGIYSGNGLAVVLTLSIEIQM